MWLHNKGSQKKILKDDTNDKMFLKRQQDDIEMLMIHSIRKNHIQFRFNEHYLYWWKKLYYFLIILLYNFLSPDEDIRNEKYKVMQKLQNTFVTFCAKCAENFLQEKRLQKEKFLYRTFTIFISFKQKPAKLIFC